MSVVRIIIQTVIVSLLFVSIAAKSSFSAPPSFPSCLNPQGTLKVQYDSGNHGIAGQDGLKSGSDAVYTISEDSLIQCFCTEDGAGIQTNWWKASSLEIDEIQSLQDQGWILIPDGFVWGLSQGSYLAKNVDYGCKGGGSPTTTNTISSSSSNSNSNSSSSSSNSSSSNGGGSSNSSSSSSALGQILSLASTGNIIFIYSIFITGILLLIAGILMEIKSHKHS